MPVLDLTSVLAAALLGVAMSVAIERLMTPHPPLRRPVAAWAVHVGLWFLAHAAVTLALGRPWFAAAVVCAFWLVLVQVNNAKYKSLLKGSEIFEEGKLRYLGPEYSGTYRNIDGSVI